MDESVFRFIWRFSRRDQLWIVVLVLLSLPFYFLSLDIPKTIVNKAIQGDGFPESGVTTAFSLTLPEGWWGGPYTVFDGIELDRISFLIWMSFAFFALVIVNGLFKLIINTLKGRMGERMLRRLRFMLFDRILRFPFAHFRRVKAPELATMIKDEVEPLGGFIGDAYVQPIFLGGQTLTALAFILTQNLWLGLLAGSIALLQAMLIPKMRAPILELGRQRQLTARDLAGRIGEAVDGIEQIRVNGTGRFERADIAARLGAIFLLRFQLYQKKFSVKFINNLLSQLTPFLFYAIGGYLAIKGTLDVGQLVAVIVAYKDLPGPMKELIDWDQRRQDTQIKYEQVVSQFVPDGAEEPFVDIEDGPSLDGPLTLSNVTITETGERPMVDHVSLSLTTEESVAMVGPGAARIIETIAGLRAPTSGELKYGSVSSNGLSGSTTGRDIAYLGPSVYLRGPTVFDTMAYPLKRRPCERTDSDLAKRREALRAGNSKDDVDVDWIDYGSAGVSSASDLRQAMIDALNIVEMEDDLFRWGLREPVATSPESTRRILRARKIVANRLSRDGLSKLVEPFDIGAFNGNATIAENLRFGAASRSEFGDRQLAANAHMIAVLRRCGLYERLLETGREIGRTLVEMFEDISPDNPLIEQFSFVDASELRALRATLNRSKPTAEDNLRLLALTFCYVDVRHRLDILDDDLRSRIVDARRIFRETLGSQDRHAIAFYDPEESTPGAPLLDDILLGRITNSLARSRERVEALIFDALDAEGLLPVVLSAGLDHEIGVGGRQLNASQRQRVGLARAMLRRPKILLLNDAMLVVDEMQARRILTRVVGLREGQATYASLARPQYADIFGRRISFEDGRLLRDERRQDKETNGDLKDEVAILGKIPLFTDLEVSTLKLLAFASERVTFDAGQELFHQGDEARCAYVIVSGEAEVSIEGPMGSTLVASIDSGHFVGELALLAGTVRSATVQATGELVALEISKELFLRMIEEYPGLALKMMQELGQRLQETTAKILENERRISNEHASVQGSASDARS